MWTRLPVGKLGVPGGDDAALEGVGELVGVAADRVALGSLLLVEDQARLGRGCLRVQADSQEHRPETPRGLG